MTEVEFIPTEEFVELSICPNFSNPFPDDHSIFGVYFDLKLSQWLPWENTLKEFQKES
jgi:hypothetical protein